MFYKDEPKFDDYIKNLIKNSYFTFSSNDELGYKGIGNVDDGEKYIAPVAITYECVARSTIPGFSVFRSLVNNNFVVVVGWIDPVVIDRMRQVISYWQNRYGDWRFVPKGNFGRFYSVISEHVTNSTARKAMRKVAKQWKDQFDTKYSKNISLDDKTRLKSKLGKNNQTGYIGDLVTYCDHTYGVGWIWRIIAEDNNACQYGTGQAKNMLTLEPVWVGFGNVKKTKKKETLGCHVEPLDLVSLGEGFSKLKDLILNVQERKSGEN